MKSFKQGLAFLSTLFMLVMLMHAPIACAQGIGQGIRDIGNGGGGGGGGIGQGIRDIGNGGGGGGGGVGGGGVGGGGVGGGGVGGGGVGGGGGGGGGGSILEKIYETTLAILQSLNKLPGTLDKLYFTKWTTQDDDQGNKQNSTMSSNFSQYGQLLTSQSSIQNDFLATLNAAQLNTSEDTAFAISNQIQSSSSNSITPQNIKGLKYANDLVYSTLLGHPFSPSSQKNSNSPYNYIRNASGMNIYHIIPNAGWKGDTLYPYQNYYNTVMAVESFGAYVLSAQYAENKLNEENAKKGSGDKSHLPSSADLQRQLLDQATNPSWFDTVTAEPLGYITRQSLMYLSQIFVLLNEQLKVQKQMVTAQVMTNAVMIAANQQMESVYIMNATKNS